MSKAIGKDKMIMLLSFAAAGTTVIAGTAVLAILYFTSRLHLLPEGNMQGGIPQGNMPPGNFTREGPRGPQGGLGIISGSALPIELCQIAFIVLYSIQSVIISRRQKASRQTS